MKIATVTEATAGTMIAIVPAITASTPHTMSHLRPCLRPSLSASCITHLSLRAALLAAPPLRRELPALCPFTQRRELLPRPRVRHLLGDQPGAPCGRDPVGPRAGERGDAMGVGVDEDRHAGGRRRPRMHLVEGAAVGGGGGGGGGGLGRRRPAPPPPPPRLSHARR